MLYVQFITDGCSTGEEFKNVWRTAKNSYGENSWQFNKYLWKIGIVNKLEDIQI